MNRKTHITQFTESEFLQLTRDVCDAVGDSDTIDRNTDTWDSIVEHPMGTDLIYWPNATEDGPGEVEDVTPEEVVEKVKQWYADQGKPCFKKG